MDYNFSIISFLVLSFEIVSIYSYIIEPGPAVIATKGEVWPKPAYIFTKKEYYMINPKEFKFEILNNNCSILQHAINRYHEIISITNTYSKSTKQVDIIDLTTDGKLYKTIFRGDNYNLGYLDTLVISFNQPCADKDLPHVGMDEGYKLNINEKSKLSAVSVWGIIRGFETFSQLIYRDHKNKNLIINVTEIDDVPRFPHRGLLIDTSRHYLPVPVILQNLDAMSYNKFNVFHWHIVDDQSFPFQSVKYPELSKNGAYRPGKIYTPDDVKYVIEYARLRGIRVVPEFDTPGHTRSWGEGIKDILTKCYDNNKPTGKYGPMDPSSNTLYTFLDTFFGEVINVFPDEYLHLGGDEVEFECWESNKALREFMASLNITDNYEALENYYIQKLLNIVENKHKAKTIVWEEVFVNGVNIPNSTIVHVWKIGGDEVVDKATRAGKRTIVSHGYYLDSLSSGGDWRKFYERDPFDFGGTPEQMKLVWGGEACMWAEVVNEFNIGPRVWPRASAVAEKLWSQYDADDLDNTIRRIEEHVCRMNTRGIPAQPPNGPGVCL